jgi:RNA ligase
MTSINQILDVKSLEFSVQEGMISCTAHPTLPLLIYNYTHAAQHEAPSQWNEAMNTCRGLIITKDGDVIARPFRKFWNYGQDYVPPGVPEVTEKLDGSLGIYWSYKGEEGIATRGSFASEQAQWATKWYEDHIGHIEWLGATSLFEIIAAWNQIVVKYPKEGLMLLSIVDTPTGIEGTYDEVKQVADYHHLEMVGKSGKTIAQCLAENNKNEEGYVLAWKFPDRPPYRVKVKFADYMRLHKLLTGVNPKAIWEILMKSANAADDLRRLTENTPEDFTAWTRKWSDKLTGDVADLQARALLVYNKFRTDCLSVMLGFPTPHEQRKFAAAYFNQYKDLAPLLFRMLDGKPYHDLLWKMVKPQGTDTFRADRQ